MTIQPSIMRVRDGSVTASGIQVVPDPILSMLTPAGPIIMLWAESRMVGMSMGICIAPFFLDVSCAAD
jgi:hypothetical protein